MSKETKKKPRLQYNREVIKTLVAKYGFSDYYIRQCVAGRKKGVSPDKIKAEYKRLENALEIKKHQFLNQN